MSQGVDTENRIDGYGNNWNAAASVSSYGHGSPPVSSVNENMNTRNYQGNWNSINQSVSPSITTPLQFYDTAIVDVQCSVNPPQSLSPWSDHAHQRQLESSSGIGIQPRMHWQGQNDAQRYQNWSADAGDNLATVSDNRYGSWPNSNRLVYYSDIPSHQVSLFLCFVSRRSICYC